MSATNTSKAPALPISEKLEYRDPQCLKAHPLNAQLYRTLAGPATGDLRESIREKGIIEPLLVTAEDVIVSGHRRKIVAIELGLNRVPVRVVQVDDDHQIERLLLDGNIYRDKSTDEKLREFGHHLKLEALKAQKRKGTRKVAGEQGCDPAEHAAPDEKGRARDIAAKKVGLSSRNAIDGWAVLQAIDAHSKSKADEQGAKDLRRILNDKSIHAAHTQASALGWIDKGSATHKTGPDSKKPRTNGSKLDHREITHCRGRMTEALTQSTSPANLAVVEADCSGRSCRQNSEEEEASDGFTLADNTLFGERRKLQGFLDASAIESLLQQCSEKTRDDQDDAPAPATVAARQRLVVRLAEALNAEFGGAPSKVELEAAGAALEVVRSAVTARLNA
jgi:hypothetical protein